MEKDVHLSRWELVKYNFLVLPRSWWHLRTFLLIWIAVVAISWLSRMSDPGFDLGVGALMNTALVAFVMFLFWYCTLLWHFVSGDHGDDMTGVTKYSIDEEGFRYVTDSTDSVTRWDKVKEVKVVGGMMYVELASFQFRLLPKHQFGSSSEFRAFHDEIAARIERAKTSS